MTLRSALAPMVRCVAALACATAILATAALSVVAAEPSASPAAPGGDPRSSGQGPGLVGDPLFAIGMVLVVGLISAVLALAWVRLTARGGRGGNGRS